MNGYSLPAQGGVSCVKMSDAIKRVQEQLRLHGERSPSHATLGDVQRWSDAAETVIHIAVMAEPYLSKVERGEKYIESRLTKINIPPFNRAHQDDVILFKRSGGPVVALAQVTQVLFEHLNTPHDLSRLVTQYADGLGYEDGYADIKTQARYASLLWLGDVQAIDAIALHKRGQQAWLTFDPSMPDPTLF